MRVHQEYFFLSNNLRVPTEDPRGFFPVQALNMGSLLNAAFCLTYNLKAYGKASEKIGNVEV